MRLRDKAIAGLCVLMADRSISQRQLARLTGVSEPRISTLINKRPNVTLDSLERYAAALGYTVELTFRRKDDE